MTDWAIRIVVQGKAAPAGSKRSVTNKKTGQSFVIDANKNAAPWKAYVASEGARQYHGPLLDGPLDVEFVIVRARPKNHYGTGRNAHVLKDSAPLQPTSAPDTTKLVRGVEDALTGIVWVDDAQIVNQSAQKRYGDKPRVEVRIRETSLTTVRDLLMLGQDRVEAPSELLPFEQLTLVG